MEPSAESAGPPPHFTALWPHVDAIPGWLTEAQARLLHQHAAAVPPGQDIVEIGSHLGRSLVVLATAAPSGIHVVGIDPFLSDWRYGRGDTERLIRRNLADNGLTDRVDLRVQTSADALRGWSSEIGLLYIDGAHDHASVRHDLRWCNHVAPGGVVLIHDSFSSIGVTTGLLRDVLWSRSLRYLGREGSLAVFRVEAPTLADRRRFLAALPWWLRNITIKILLRLRLRRVARLMGHHISADPF